MARVTHDRAVDRPTPVDAASNRDRVAAESSLVEAKDPRRRKLLVRGVTAAGGLGAVAFIAPLLSSLSPSARALSAGAPVEVDFSKLEPGRLLTVEWRGQPVWVVHRTKRTIDGLDKNVVQLADPDSSVDQQPPYAKNVARAIKPQYFIVIGICTHLGCSPSYRPEIAPPDLGSDWNGGFFCPCHGSRFDMAGRVYVRVPAPTNLVVPPHRYVDERLIVIGEDPENQSGGS